MDGPVDGFAGPRATLKAITVAIRTRKKKNDDFGTVYRGHEGQWSWLFHRVTGVAIILFLFAHVVDTAVIGWGPEAYNRVTAAYKNPLVHVLELGLVTAVIYHSLNGLKITLIDLFPSLAGHIKALGRTTTLLFLLCMIPVVAIMGKQTLDLL
jgi:succinate dehydrogenase / fumarate reductase cytochrome b subunit